MGAGVIAWLVLAVHLAGMFFTAWTCAGRRVDQLARIELRSRRQMAKSYRPEDRDRMIADQGPLGTARQRTDALTMGLLPGLIWPMHWAGRGMLALLRRAPLKSPTEAAEEQRRELEALRRLAMEHNLAMPETEL
jgi:hypothetical protein